MSCQREGAHVKYMLLIHGNSEGWKDLDDWSQEDLQAMVRFMHGINADLSASGELLDAQGLAGPEYAKTVRAGQDGEPIITDGPSRRPRRCWPASGCSRSRRSSGRWRSPREYGRRPVRAAR